VAQGEGPEFKPQYHKKKKKKNPVTSVLPAPLLSLLLTQRESGYHVLSCPLKRPTWRKLFQASKFWSDFVTLQS
jgi:hypothetical protein